MSTTDGHGNEPPGPKDKAIGTASTEKPAVVKASSSQEEDEGSGVEGRREPEKKPAALKGFFDKLGLDAPTVKMMFKGSLPPIIATSIYQAPAISSTFSTVGYEIAIITVLAIAILPRGKYLQTLLLNLIAVLLGSALAMLVLWSGVKARLHTTSNAIPGRAVPYNSSQSAVCAVWLFFNIWAVNLVRAKMPSFNVPAIVYSILVNIAAMYGPLIVSTAAAWALVRQLLALGIATGVSLLVFPVSSRVVVMKQLGAGVMLLRKAVRLQGEYLRSLESEDMFALRVVETCVAGGAGVVDGKSRNEKTGRKGKAKQLIREEEVTLALKSTIIQLRDLAGRLQGDMPFAKREVAWGKLDAHDLGEIFKLFRSVFIPVMGMSTVMDIFRRTAEMRGWATDCSDSSPPQDFFERRLWNGLMQQLHEPFAILSEAIDEGLEHAGLQLELLPRPKGVKKKGQIPTPSASAEAEGESASQEADPDIEARGDAVSPGESEFGKVIEEKIQKFYSRKGEILRYWAGERGLLTDLDNSNSNSNSNIVRTNKQDQAPVPAPPLPGPKDRERSQRQLYVLLYMEQLMHATGEAVHSLVLFADAKVATGTLSRPRLLTPSPRRLRRCLGAVFSSPGPDTNAEEPPDVLERAGAGVVHMGDGFSRRARDPEHLPADGAWERAGDQVRAVSALLSSEQSAFGFRVACATMTIAIVGFLQETQVFFQEQRLVWAMIIIAIGMTQTSGQSIFGFFCRIGGTILAMVFSLIIWYIVGQKTPGVIIMLWLFIFVEYYFFIKFPRFIPAAMLVIITQVLIVGYELQVEVIGVEASERLGQPFYPTYLLAPYRVATVAGGCLVAFIWTVFPSPSTDRTWLRRDLSATLYLLANYFNAITQTIKLQLDEVGDEDGGGASASASHARHLARVRQKIFGKLMLMLPSLETHSQWQKWEPTIGGRFPRETYDDILLRSSRILNYLTLMSYTATRSPHTIPSSASDTRWLRTLRTLLSDVQPTHHTILSTLTLLSNSLLSGQSLPPFIRIPRPYELTQQPLRSKGARPSSSRSGSSLPHAPAHSSLRSEGEAAGNNHDDGDALADILDARNIEQRGYTEFAVLQVCSTLVRDDLEGLARAVEQLVGVVDFSFRVDVVGKAKTASRWSTVVSRISRVDGGGGDPGDDEAGAGDLREEGASSSSDASSDGEGMLRRMDTMLSRGGTGVSRRRRSVRASNGNDP